MTRQELLAIAKPMLFNTEMMQANLENRKTETRRVIKLGGMPIPTMWTYRPEESNLIYAKFVDNSGVIRLVKRPYIGAGVISGKGGDIIYARETWCWCPCWDCGMNTEKGCCDDIANKFYNDQRKEKGCYGYRASFETGELPFDKWRPSIHMPKEAARWFARVKAVRAERVQDITEEQCEKEGMTERQKLVLNKDEYWYWFRKLWDSTQKPVDLPLYSWDANPWVWVIEYERVIPDGR